MSRVEECSDITFDIDPGRGDSSYLEVDTGHGFVFVTKEASRLLLHMLSEELHPKLKIVEWRFDRED